MPKKDAMVLLGTSTAGARLVLSLRPQMIK